MKDIKDLNNEELSETNGRERRAIPDEKFHAGDWIIWHEGIDGDCSDAYYVKEVFDDTYHLILYALRPESSSITRDPSCHYSHKYYYEKIDLHEVPIDCYCYPRYRKSNKPLWVEE